MIYEVWRREERLGGEGVELTAVIVVQELCCAGELRNRASDGGDVGADGYLYGSRYCLFVKGNSGPGK